MRGICGQIGLLWMLLAGLSWADQPVASQLPHPPPSASSQTAPYLFGVEVGVVTLFATVHDVAGRLVTNLSREDFILYDNDQRQTISQFSREYIPLSVVILLDTSGSMYGVKLENARKSLEQFLRRLNPGDEVMLVGFQTRPRVLQTFTRDLGLVRRRLKELEGTGSTALYDSILFALNQSHTSYNRRRALLLISDGINTYGKAELDETIMQLRRRGIELFAIGLETNLPEYLQHNRLTRAVLGRLTESAGGEAFIISHTRELSGVCEAISERMHNQYAFAYYPPRDAAAEWRTIRLETRTPSLRVTPSRKGYFAIAGDGAAAPGEPPPGQQH